MESSDPLTLGSLGGTEIDSRLQQARLARAKRLRDTYPFDPARLRLFAWRSNSCWIDALCAGLLAWVHSSTGAAVVDSVKYDDQNAPTWHMFLKELSSIQRLCCWSPKTQKELDRIADKLRAWCWSHGPAKRNQTSSPDELRRSILLRTYMKQRNYGKIVA